eukprot:m.252347 g.252347  ORF g.252347 m.252347 type:complete len:332 (+) comp19564_c0_seq2:189-1184(+)
MRLGAPKVVLAFCAAVWVYTLFLMLDARNNYRRENYDGVIAAESVTSCGQSARLFNGKSVATVKGLPYVYLITPTYARYTQKVDLYRMCYTLRLVPNVIWIIIEDAEEKTELVKKFVEYCSVRIIHKNARTPPDERRKPCTKIDRTKGCPPGSLGKLEASFMVPRGINQRNAGLQALRDLRPTNGAFYFADDDNTYSVELFEVIRRVSNVSTWMVGFSGGLLYEGPEVDANGVIEGWHVGWRPDRPFPIDMAAFAIHVDALKNNPNLKFTKAHAQGMLESEFLLQVVGDKSHVTAVPNTCNCVLVWHTRTEHPFLNQQSKMDEGDDVDIEL